MPLAARAILVAFLLLGQPIGASPAAAAADVVGGAVPTYVDLDVGEAVRYQTVDGVFHTIVLRSEALNEVRLTVDGTVVSFILTNGSPGSQDPIAVNGVRVLAEVTRSIAQVDAAGRLARLKLGTKAARLHLSDAGRPLPAGVLPYRLAADPRQILDKAFLEQTSYGLHFGIDFAMPEGTPVQAVRPATVRYIDTDPSGAEGIEVDIQDGDFIYRYMHLSRVASGLAVGQAVSKGQLLGYSGMTGTRYPHLHIGIEAKALGAVYVNAWPFISAWAGGDTVPVAPTATRTRSATRTATVARTATRTPTRTATRTATRTRSATRTATRTLTAAPLSSPTRTRTRTPSPMAIGPPAPTGPPGPQWTIADDGAFITVENNLIRARFAYGGATADGWFNQTGGKDGALVELYYKPTSPTRNLLFRNGAWGSGYDGLDRFEAEYSSKDRLDYNTPDLRSTVDARVIGHSVRESAGRVLVDVTIEMGAWRIARHYILYPWGKITVSADIEVIKEGYYHYLAHRFSFAGSRYTFTNRAEGTSYSWGTTYQEKGARVRTFCDGRSRYDGRLVNDVPTYLRYDQTILANQQRNTVCTQHDRHDQYSGYLIDDTAGTDPDVVVMLGSPDTWNSPYTRIAHKVAQHPYSLSDNYAATVESALFSYDWAPNNETQVGATWFYSTKPGISPDGWIWDEPGWWSTSLGRWSETHHVLLERGLTAADYLALWQEAAHDLIAQAPRDVAGASARLSPRDMLVHLRADGSSQITFTWGRASAHPGGRALNYRTSFVVEGFGPIGAVLVDGVAHASVKTYHSAAENITLVVLDFAQPATPRTYQITVTKDLPADPAAPMDRLVLPLTSD